ncbi:TRAP transporter large permease subunit, partial [Pacificibacter marinus]|uniref:TRAP transporter large permease subunit n=1 Tax=Pacificibacter marinus TaxID=658057 RepID=UPI00339D8E0E
MRCAFHWFWLLAVCLGMEKLITHPIALQYGIDPLHFGFIFVLNLVICMLTPPVGVVLFVVTGITGCLTSALVGRMLPDET